jgi:HprK-related kinase A
VIASPLHAAGISLATLRQGVRLAIGPFKARIRGEHEGLVEHLRTLYVGYPTWDGEECHFDLAIVNGERHRRWIKPQAAITINTLRPYWPLPIELAGAMLEWGFNQCIGLRTHHVVSAHAAVVERDGKALILPAPSGSGKSTLCAALVYSGWRLFSDEFALVVPGTSRLLPSPRPLSLKEGTIDLVRRRYPDIVLTPERRDVEEQRFVHARPPDDSIRRWEEAAEARWIVLPKYLPGSATTFERITKAQALMELIGQSFNYNHVADGFSTIVALVDRCDCFLVEYSDLDDLLPRLRDLR